MPLHYCNELQLIRYDRYGAQYGESLEGAKLWIEQRDLPSPEDYLEELLVKVPADKYPKIFSEFSQTYKQQISFKLKYPKQDLYYILRRTIIWLLQIFCFIIPIGIYQIMRSLLVEPKKDVFGQNYYTYRGRLRVRNNKHGLLVMGIPAVFYIIVLAIVL